MAQLSVNKEVCIGNFLKLSDGAQACYFALLLFADSVGFCNKTFVLASGNYDESALHELAANGFVFEIGDVIVIRHWFLHANRKTNNTTMFTEIRSLLQLKDWIYELNDTVKRNSKK